MRLFEADHLLFPPFLVYFKDACGDFSMGETMKLRDLKGPDELRSASEEDLKELADDIRGVMIRTVSANGGHLSSNLGTVELTLSLYHTFDFSKDKLVFDVGHQCYTHKLITGRYPVFSTLRTDGGISGFLRMEESPYDLFNTGHSSTALSLCAGLCRAEKLTGQNNRIIALVGDGAMTGGMCYEALNDIGRENARLIIVLNDNGMSISNNVGALSQYLTYMRLSKGWQQLKHGFSELLLKVPVCGKKLHERFQNFKDHIRNVFINDKFFSSLGIRYLGPVDGHDIRHLSAVLKKASNLEGPILIHTVTQKGKGYPPAEADPERFHGIGPFDIRTGTSLENDPAPSFGKAACSRLIELAEKDPRLVLLTAAMTQGTGMEAFAKRFPDRSFDAGIAEEHCVTMAAGMAKGGLKPVVAIYDTFLQRTYDQIMEDVCFQKLPVLFLVDRAGFASGDGASHHGVYGISYLRSIPNMRIFCPRNVEELNRMLDCIPQAKSPAAIRYPRSESACDIPYSAERFVPGKWEKVLDGTDACICAVGSMVPTAVETARILEKEHIRTAVYNCSSVVPLDTDVLDDLSRIGIPFFTMEENELAGGFGSAVTEYCARGGLHVPGYLFALPKSFLPHGDRQKALRNAEMDPVQAAARIRERIQREGKS